MSNFNISGNKVPGEFVRNYLKVKKVYAIVNQREGKLSNDKSKSICKAIKSLLKKDNDDLEKLLPIDIFQSGGGTSVNIPINELISEYCDEEVDPYDDINMSQSSNDTFPSVVKITTYFQLIELITQLESLKNTYSALINNNKGINKVGRTHMQDALEIAVTDELSAHLETIKKSIKSIKNIINYCIELPLGATALGSMQNISKKIRKEIIKEVNKEYKVIFKSPSNYYESVSSSGDILKISSTITCITSDLLKISKDFILLSSGPRSGLNEVTLFESQKGSSIMPGKVNPSIFEAMCMICFKVIGNSHTIELASQNAQLQLQAFNPIIGFTIYENIEILNNGLKMFNIKGLSKISFNREGIAKQLENSTVYATRYSEKLGYEKVAQLYKQSLKENINLKELLDKELDKVKNI